MLALEGMSARNLKVSYESMETFRNRVRNILDELRSSKATPQAVADQQVESHALHSGGSFAEAEALSRHYTAVQMNLTQMADIADRLLDALAIAMRGAEDGYQNLDEDERQRFHSVNTEVYERHQEHTKPEKGTPPADGHDKGAF